MGPVPVENDGNEPNGGQETRLLVLSSCGNLAQRVLAGWRWSWRPVHECPGELWSGFRGQPAIQWLKRGPREDRDLNWRRWGGGAQGSQASNQTPNGRQRRHEAC